MASNFSLAASFRAKEVGKISREEFAGFCRRSALSSRAKLVADSLLLRFDAYLSRYLLVGLEPGHVSLSRLVVVGVSLRGSHFWAIFGCLTVQDW